MSEPEYVFTIAIIGPVYGYPDEPAFDGPTFEDQAPDVPYAERLKVTVPASSSTPLGEVIDQAGSELGIVSHYHDRLADALVGIGFYEPQDDAGLGQEPGEWQSRLQATIRIVDDGGRPSWAIRWVDLRVGELLDAGAAGLVAGDPLRPYLWPAIPQGGMLLHVYDSLWTLWLHWEHVLAAYGTVDVARRMLRRISKGQDGLSTQHGLPWWKRLNRPNDFFGYLAATPRSAPEVASLVGCSELEAEAVLWGMGFVSGEDRLWRPAQDDPSRLLYESLQDIRILGRVPSNAELEIRIRDERAQDEPE